MIITDNKGERQYRLSTGSNYVYEDGRKSAKMDYGRTSGMVKGGISGMSSKEDSKSMIMPSTDRTSQKSNLRNAKSMMIYSEAPDT